MLGILEGLDDEQLRRSVLPSGWSCLGLVKHLALSDEHYWFRCIMGGESLEFFSENDLNNGGDWRVAPEETSESIFALYRAEWARSNEIVAVTPLGPAPAQVEELVGRLEGARPGLHPAARDYETACHAGHLDVVRELFDGRQWFAF